MKKTHRLTALIALLFLLSFTASACMVRAESIYQNTIDAFADQSIYEYKVKYAFLLRYDEESPLGVSSWRVSDSDGETPLPAEGCLCILRMTNDDIYVAFTDSRGNVLLTENLQKLKELAQSDPIYAEEEAFLTQLVTDSFALENGADQIK